MDVINKFLDKYSYRFPKGYPDLTDPADKKLMQELLSEVGISEAPETNNSFDNAYRGKLQDAKLSDKAIDEIKSTYDKLAYVSEPKNTDGINYRKKFYNAFRKKSITDIKEIFDIFKDYINIRDKGMGAGEITTLLGVAGSKSGGTADKDILVGSNIYDVKELDTDGQFRTASGGYITISDFKHNLDYFISLLTKLVKTKNSKEVTGDPDIDKLITDLLIYYNSAYKSGGISTGTFGDITKLCNDLSTYEFEAGKINKSYVKIGNKKFAVDQETYDKIEKGEDIRNITLGSEIEIEADLLTKIKNHPWVKNPKVIEKELNDVWGEFLNTINGLILINKKTGIPTLYTSDDLKNQFAPIRVVQNQINVREKNRTKDKIKEDEDEDLYND